MSDTTQNRNRKIKSRQLIPHDESPVQEKRTQQDGSKTGRNANINRKKGRNKKKVYSGKADGQRQSDNKKTGNKQAGRQQTKQRATKQQGQRQTVGREEHSDKNIKKQQESQKPAATQQAVDKKKNVAANAQTAQKKTSQQTKSNSYNHRPRRRRFDNIDEKKIRAVETAADVRRDIEQIERDIRLDIDGIQTIHLDL